ncbi:MAG: hypothetical protein M3R08_05465, partial [Bacteroidota bacterium]|nr:hypothetical protein [Bacteroidota bacterium]
MEATLRNSTQILLNILFAGFLSSSLVAQWEPQPINHSNLKTASILDQSRTIAAGQNGKMYSTTNGGSLWSEVAWPPELVTTGELFRSAHMLDTVTWIFAGESFFANREMIYRTTTSGDTMTLVHQGPVGSSINEMIFTNDTIGICVGKDGRILRSQDHGVTWQLVPTVLTGDLLAVVEMNNGDIIAGGAGYIIRSEDSGLSWSIVYFSSQRIFVDLQTGDDPGVIFGIDSEADIYQQLIVSVNEGITWTNVSTPFITGLSLCTIGTDTIFIAGGIGMYASINGGDTWFNYPEFDDMQVNAIKFTDDLVGYAVGYGDRIYRMAGSMGSPTPVAYFSPVTFTVCLNEEIHFTNGSPEGQSYIWYVNGQQVATTFDLDHTFTTPGQTQVSLEVFGLGDTSIFYRNFNIPTADP